MGNFLLGEHPTRIYNRKQLPAISTNCRALTSNHSSSASMTLNPLVPTFPPQQRSTLYSFSQLKTLFAMNFSKPCDSPAIGAIAPTANFCSPQMEEQIHSLSAQLNQLQAYSESSFQQTTPVLQKFPLAHLKQVQYLHSVQLTVAQLHQDLEAEKLERQILQLLVLQLQKDLMFTQNILMNLKTGTLSKPFFIDPPSVGTAMNPSVPETHELSRAHSSQIILLGDFKTFNTVALPSSPTLRSPLWSFRCLIQQHLRTQPLNLTPRKNNKRWTLTSEVTTLQHTSNFPFLYDKIRQLEASSINAILWQIPSAGFVFDSAKSAHRQSRPIEYKTSGYWSRVFRTHPYGYNFIIQLHPYEIDTAAGQFATLISVFFPGDFDGLLRWPLPKIFHLRLRGQLDPLNAWTQTIQLTKEPLSDDQHPLPKVMHSLLPLQIHSTFWTFQLNWRIHCKWYLLYWNIIFWPNCAEIIYPKTSISLFP